MKLWNQNNVSNVGVGDVDGWGQIIAIMISGNHVMTAMGIGMRKNMYRTKLICVQDGKRHHR